MELENIDDIDGCRGETVRMVVLKIERFAPTKGFSRIQCDLPDVSKNF
jgi:hypothetical protein